MEWLLTNPQINSTFASLGTKQGDSYTVSPDVLATLQEINCKLTCEDQTLRTFRCAIGFGQNVKIDLIPLLIHAKDPEVVDATIRILVNLTVPAECLFSVDVMYRTEVGRHTLFEINKLLITTKEAFTDPKSTKSIIDFMKRMLETEKKLTVAQSEAINNCLLLIRNILHIPEDIIVTQGHHVNSCTSMQNTIMWNLFTQSIDKLLLHLMSCTERSSWGVTMVQLIALMYKDQHVSTLQKLLNIWFEASLSESSDDNESNTSPPKEGSGDSSPMLTSDPTSDSSDNGIGKQGDGDERRQATMNKESETTLQQISRKGHEKHRISNKSSEYQQIGTIKPPHSSHSHGSHQSHKHKDSHGKGSGLSEAKQNILFKSLNKFNQVKNVSASASHGSIPSTSTKGSLSSGKSCTQKRDCPSSQSELSDCGYGTQVENQESISTSSNEDDGPCRKPVHQKPPTTQKQRFNATNKPRQVATPQDRKEWRRKKLVKRSKSNLINMKGLVQHIPTDEDISHILKEFTVDFLLKGYGYLVQELHAQLLSDISLQMDTSHFFWLVTYFLKFAAQLELDLEHISAVLSFDIVSYLTYEGVTLCEQLELTSSQQGRDLKPYLRRIHLVVTAVREFLQTLETYKKITHLSQEDRNHLRLLQMQISATDELRCLFILLIRRYNPIIQSRQYLQDLIVTNHLLLMLLDGVAKFPESNANLRITEHIAQFATADVMHQYGLLLEGFRENGEFVNDCIFTMMHHIGGDLGHVTTLFQPAILKTYTLIWETEYELCDDWADLIEYVIHKFMNTPQKRPAALPSPSLTEMTKEYNMEYAISAWTQEEMDTLYWYYVQSKKFKDIVGKIVQLFKENGNKKKSRIVIIQQLLQQDIITLVEYDDLMKYEDVEYQRCAIKTQTPSTSTGESGIDVKDEMSVNISDDIQILILRLLKENKAKLLTWLQKILIECCYVKLNIIAGKSSNNDILDPNDVKVMQPVPYHCILKKKSIPVVPYNTEQATIMLYQPFVLLLHKLGFHLPTDAGKIFVRIPDFWTADILYSTAEKLGPIDKTLIKFDLSLLNGVHAKAQQSKRVEDSSCEAFAIPRMKHTNSIIRFTPDPTSTPSVPNWLQLVMRSKSTPSDSEPQSDSRNQSSTDSRNTSISGPSNSLSTANDINNMSFGSQMNSGNSMSEDDGPSKPAEPATQEELDIKKDQMDKMYNSMVASVYESEAKSCDTDSVESDLTRMYVSDEED
uniref:Putative dna topoisomerase i-interacting protein n=1 Tax=Tabanus bromius TaxID=304241 RepID=A0A0K8TSI5_TABBR